MDIKHYSIGTHRRCVNLLLQLLQPLASIDLHTVLKLSVHELLLAYTLTATSMLMNCCGSVRDNVTTTS